VSEPIVSVVVATHDRPVRLGRLIAAMGAQTLPPAAFELIVVDDGSGPATAEMLRRNQAAGHPPLRVIRSERARGPAAARNRGWRASRAPLVAFTDDDCVPAPGWLAALAAAAERHPGTILQGRTQPDPAERPGGSRLLLRSRQIEHLGPSFEACNILYPRTLLEATGGFDEAFGPRSPGEDTDLAWRAFERGHGAKFVPEALVHHAVEALSPWRAFAEAWRWGECARVFARHPGARRTILHHRVFWNAWHYLLIRSVAALMGPPWLRRLILARHATVLAARAQRAESGLRAVPYLLLYDTVETAGCLRGAVRHRTPLL
jgi:glycosyltransferase involved in cell wall biosynthesis